MSTTKGKNILIVDDEDLVNLFQTFLEYDGYKVDAFTNPIDALYSFRKNVYDLALLDLKMPKMNGMKLSQKLKNIDPTLLYRFITAANKEYIEHLKKNNPDIEKIIIYKPIWLNELRSKVHSLLSNHHHHQQKEDKDKLWMLISIFSSSILVSSILLSYHHQ
jgi:DNA-binding response OmpR family regulator